MSLMESKASAATAAPPLTSKRMCSGLYILHVHVHVVVG